MLTTFIRRFGKQNVRKKNLIVKFFSSYTFSTKDGAKICLMTEVVYNLSGLRKAKFMSRQSSRNKHAKILIASGTLTKNKNKKYK